MFAVVRVFAPVRSDREYCLCSFGALALVTGIGLSNFLKIKEFQQLILSTLCN